MVEVVLPFDCLWNGQTFLANGEKQSVPKALADALGLKPATAKKTPEKDDDK